MDRTILTKDRVVFFRFLLFISIVIFIIYSHAFTNGFIWDDTFLIIKNGFIRDLSFLDEAFTTDLFAYTGLRSNFYRPIQTLSYMFDYSIWGLKPLGYHLGNILIHLLNVGLVFFLSKAISKNNRSSIIAALLFAIHPVHTEAVSYVSGRADLLVSAFLLAGLLLYIKSSHLGNKQKNVYLLVSAVFFLFALLSKEIALIFPLILLFYDRCFNYDNAMRKARVVCFRYLPFLLVVIIYFLLRNYAFHEYIAHSAEIKITLYERLLTIPKIILEYLKILILPLDLHMDRYVEPENSLLSLKFFIPGVIVVMLFSLFFTLKEKYRDVFFAAGWFLIFLLPSLNLIKINAAIAEHWLYLPSIGFFLIVAMAMSAMLRFSHNGAKAATIILLLVICGFWGYKTFERDAQWGRPEFFFKKIIKDSGEWQVDRPYLNLALLYYGRQEYVLALGYVEKTLEINPVNVKALVLLGGLYGVKGENIQAIEQFKKAVALDERNPEAYYNLGIVYAKMDKLDEAIVLWKKTLELNPYHEAAPRSIYKAIKILRKRSHPGDR